MSVSFFVQFQYITLRRPKNLCDPDLVEVYAPAEEQFPLRAACVFMAITNGGDYTPVHLPYLYSVYFSPV